MRKLYPSWSNGGEEEVSHTCNAQRDNGHCRDSNRKIQLLGDRIT